MSADQIEWEYSIAYPEGDWWNNDQGDCFATLAEAESEFNEFGDSYLTDDRIVRRRKAGPWEPVSEPHVSEEADQ